MEFEDINRGYHAHPRGNDPELLSAWEQGQTGYPLIDANMRCLHATGYIHFRSRAMLVSFLCHHLWLDWRSGARWFEHHLVDHDVASNWGNWQYLAGVGADPRGKRRFNLDKQTERYDPHAQFIKKWQGSNTVPLDTIDAVGWPMAHPSESNSTGSAHHSFKPMPAG